mgnify:CR=1 FL=1
MFFALFAIVVSLVMLVALRRQAASLWWSNCAFVLVIGGAVDQVGGWNDGLTRLSYQRDRGSVASEPTTAVARTAAVRMPG